MSLRAHTITIQKTFDYKNTVDGRLNDWLERVPQRRVNIKFVSQSETQEVLTVIVWYDFEQLSLTK